MNNPWDLRARAGPLAFAPVPGNRGNTAKICPPDEHVSVVDARIPGGCAWGDQLLVCLGLQWIDVDACKVPQQMNAFAGVRAIIKWGIGTIGLGSNGFSAEVDWLHGTIVAIPAENICVEARYVVCGDAKCVELPAANIAAGLAYGSGGHVPNPARLTEFVLLQTNVDVAVVPVPNFAIGVSAFSDTPFQIDAVNIAGLRTPYDPTLANDGVPLPLPNGTISVEVRAPSLVVPNKAGVAVIFGLAL